MDSKLEEIKRIQKGEFYLNSKIFIITTDNCLLLVNQDGTTYRKYPKFDSRIMFAFALDVNHVILTLELATTYVNILNLTTGEVKEFNIVVTGRKAPKITAGELVNYPFVKFYYGKTKSAIWNVETGKKESELKEEYKPFNVQIKLPDGRDVKMEEDNYQLKLIEQGKKVKNIQIGMNVQQIFLLDGTEDVILCFGNGILGKQLKTFKFPLREEPYPLETYPLKDNFLNVLPINSSEVLLFSGVREIQKFNLMTNTYTGKFLKEKTCSGLEINSFMIPSGNKFKILRCLLLIKLKKQLPRDLILETYTFLS
jgi:hypothetical protein